MALTLNQMWSKHIVAVIRFLKWSNQIHDYI